MTRALRIAMFERECAQCAIARLSTPFWTRAEVKISEGQRAERSGKDSYLGSTMVTVDLGRACRPHCASTATRAQRTASRAPAR